MQVGKALHCHYFKVKALLFLTVIYYYIVVYIVSLLFHFSVRLFLYSYFLPGLFGKGSPLLRNFFYISNSITTLIKTLTTITPIVIPITIFTTLRNFLCLLFISARFSLYLRINSIVLHHHFYNTYYGLLVNVAFLTLSPKRKLSTSCNSSTYTSSPKLRPTAFLSVTSFTV